MIPFVVILAVIIHLVKGDMEATLSQCCSLGANWGKEELGCGNFTTPVAGVSAEQLGVCLSAVEICCLRTHRERQCERGISAARSGQDCTVAPTPGGEFKKDCCEACKLGVITASMSMNCNFLTFKFGPPWDNAYQSCCRELYQPAVPAVSPQLPPIPINTQSPINKQPILPPIAENLCDLYPGELCTDICVDVPGSYVCACRDGFTLMTDGKSCEQEKHPNRCKITNPCSQRCLDTGVSIECACNPGYQLGRNNRSCEDIDECRTGSNMCQYNRGLTCRNEIGTYSCVTSDGISVKPSQLAQFAQSGTQYPPHQVFGVNNKPSKNEIETPKCPKGYQFNLTSKFCDDIDECLLGLHSCPSSNSTCKNIVGSFVCSADDDEKIDDEDSCPSGYKFDEYSLSCIDIDECSEQLDNCKEKKQFCINTEGSYVCQGKLPTRECPAGYKYNATLRNCEDVDECGENIHSCQVTLETCRNTIGAYECDVTCPDGFIFKSSESICVDIDECSTGTPVCPSSETCFNTIGGYECHALDPLPLPPPTTVIPACPGGYRRSQVPGEANLCLDVNECLEDSYLCNSNTEVCINEPGGYRCTKRAPLTTPAPPTSTTSTTLAPRVQTTITPPPPPPRVSSSSRCQSGYTFSNVEQRCVDIDECNMIEDTPCDSYQVCENTVGSFICTCKLGFQQDDDTLACVDINECQANRHECQPSQRCDNTIGSYQCIRFTSCGTGYTLNANTGFCEDDDECLLKTDNCRELGPMYFCKNTLGSFRCQRKRCEGNKLLTSSGECITQNCQHGFEPNSLGQCTDINECAQGNPCRSNQKCVNKVGSFSCVSLLDCGRGYEVSQQGNHCTDIDECAQGTHQCPPGQQCLNRPGSYVCQCQPGFAVNNAKQCVDIDECLLFRGKLQVCSSNSECQNVPGSYRCTCKQGFKHDQDDKVCADEDECTTTPGLCQQNCINSWGSYRCSCNAGFTLQSDNRSCRDIDECEEFKDRNLCVGLCVNQPGSYACQCPSGYRMSSDGRTCNDIDECSNGNVCRRPEEVCLNTRGSFLCNTIDCPPNYVRDPEHKNRCKRPLYHCRENDIECVNSPQTISYNYITFVSNMAIPPIGHLDLFTLRGPTWSSSTVRFNLDVVQARARADVAKAGDDFFRMRRLSHNQAIISLVRSIQGPQQIELKLTMDMYHNAIFSGKVVAKLIIVVSEFEF